MSAGRGARIAFPRPFAQNSAVFSLFPVSMTKTEMIEVIAKEAGITKKAAAAAFNAVGALITAELKRGHSVVITGFGTFKVSQRTARTGVNPRNPQEKIKIPAMKVPVFKAG